MRTNNERRLRKLELVGGRGHRGHLPLHLWSDEQICLYVSSGRRRHLTDDELERYIAEAPDHVLGVLAGEGPYEPHPVPQA